MSIDLQGNASLDEIIFVLRRYGVARMRGYVGAQDLARLREEFVNAFERSDRGIYSLHKHPTNFEGKVARARTRQLTDKHFKYTQKLFLSEHFDQIARDYFYPYGYILNDDIFFTHELPCEKEILPWHFDREQSLKFFLYLEDTDSNNGAFEYCLGSHNEGHFRANYYLLKGVRQRDIPNDIPDGELHNPEVIDGKAGDLILFDADGFHRGGIVSPGFERKVIRGHCHPIPTVRSRPFSKGWIAAWLHKIADQISPSVERKLGDRVRTSAVKTRSDSYERIHVAADEDTET